MLLHRQPIHRAFMASSIFQGKSNFRGSLFTFHSWPLVTQSLHHTLQGKSNFRGSPFTFHSCPFVTQRLHHTLQGKSNFRGSLFTLHSWPLVTQSLHHTLQGKYNFRGGLSSSPCIHPLSFHPFFKVNLTLDAASALHRAFIHNDSYVFHLQTKCYFTDILCFHGL
jgi:hypothetical protein